ncbi:hypothetical protein KY348_00440 [Candidatus Woesearchaeota archaeon]|nr:hypothetical protein [Candidatus Woesearchaeota archaeon]
MKFLNNKKGVQLTLSTVVIAVLVIIVLIVLIVIFTQGTGLFNIGITSCADRGGNCNYESADQCVDTGGSVYRFGKCTDGVCCIPKDKLSGQDDNQD